MINRIVKMTFRPEHTVQFENIFREKRNLIAASEGCHGVMLLRDISNSDIFFTYSKWMSEEALNNYRKSELFKSTWSETKRLFSDKPEAWSVVEVQWGDNTSND
jgi:heme-degrading monooxygenase HmoA